MSEKATDQKLLPHLFRVEYSKMTAVLCRHFGLKHIEVAEDIASETFLKASEVWALQGVPDNPTAWLYTVAKNKTKDYLKHRAIAEAKASEVFNIEPVSAESELDFTPQIISDSQLNMIFAVCNPVNSPEAQICLALQILCGFSVQEIANAFLSKPETIKKRLLRARANLRSENFQLEQLHECAIRSRLDTVLNTLYLLFNEGYFSLSNDTLIRKDLCSEAIRLTLVLANHVLTDTTHVHALLALMCYQSSRLDARVDSSGVAILFEDQNKALWDKDLIERGNYFLVNACTGNEISKYHLEAGIAYWHTTSGGEDKWQHILHLYNQLVLIEYSPMAALNRTFAIAKVYGREQALKEAEKINIKGNSFYYSLLGYLCAACDTGKAVAYYSEALRFTKSKTEKLTLTREIERLRNQKFG